METSTWTYRDGKIYDGETVIADEVEERYGRIIAEVPNLLDALKGLVGPDGDLYHGANVSRAIAVLEKCGK